jgi:hypothetical protein
MIISHKYKFIYIKFYKVAGTSTEYFLEKFCGKEDIVTPITPLESDEHTPRNFEKYKFHSHSSLSDIFAKIPKESIKDYKIIANQRNTWDRVASMYSMAYYRGKTQRDFYGWLSVHVENYLSPIYPKCKQIQEWIRYSSLESDIINFCESLGIDCENSKLLHAKKYRKKHYTDQYNKESIRMVSEAYADDIEFFGHKFGE